MILCADDYGQSVPINKGILYLAETGHITAASCMTNGPEWQDDVRIHRLRNSGITLGLHFNLTFHKPLGMMPKLASDGILPSLGKLILLSLTRQLDIEEIMAECRRQFDAFCHIAGRKPDHIDGHQHIHVFPVIRDAVLAIAHEYCCSVRLCTTPLYHMKPSLVSIPKAFVINIMACGFEKTCKRKDVAIQNSLFFGIHAFDPKCDLMALYQNWLTCADEHAMINCHPAQGRAAKDAMSDWREYEFAFLAQNNIINRTP